MGIYRPEVKWEEHCNFTCLTQHEKLVQVRKASQSLKWKRTGEVKAFGTKTCLCLGQGEKRENLDAGRKKRGKKDCDMKFASVK